MVTEKRFTLNVDGETINDGDNRYCGEDVVELLNELYEENQQIKSTIKEAYRNERTHIGESVLRQLINQIWSE